MSCVIVKSPNGHETCVEEGIFFLIRYMRAACNISGEPMPDTTTLKMDDLSENAKVTLVKAIRVCKSFSSAGVESTHLLVGMILNPTCMAYQILEDLGVSAVILAKSPPLLDQADIENAVPSDVIKTIMRKARERAKANGKGLVCTDHMLYAFVDTTCKGSELLANNGVKMIDLAARILACWGMDLKPGHLIDYARAVADIGLIISAAGADANVVQAIARYCRTHDIPCE